MRKMHIKYLTSSKYWIGDSFVINSAERKIFSDQKIEFRRSYVVFPRSVLIFYYEVFNTLRMIFLPTWKI